MASHTQSLPVIVIDEITKAGGIHDGQMQTHAVLLDIYT